VLQDVQYLKLQSQVAADEADSPAVRTVLGTMAEGLDSVARELRELSADLQPLARNSGGLAAALEQLAVRLERRHGIPVRTSVALPEDVPVAVQETLYRLAREAAGNACRHSGAPEVAVVVMATEASVVLTVADVGRGFVPAEAPPGRLGLGFLRDHAAWIGGNLELSSAPGTGTTVRVTVPRPFLRQ
jgi:signal transduction histidine kinase